MGTTRKRSRGQRFRETGGQGDAYYVRQQIGLSTRDLAQVLGCSHVTVYRWEDGLHAEPEGLYGVVVRGVAELLRRYDDDVRPLVTNAWCHSIQFGIEQDAPSLELLRRLVTVPKPPGATWEAFADDYYGDGPRPSDGNAAPPKARGKTTSKTSAPATARRRAIRRRTAD